MTKDYVFYVKGIKAGVIFKNEDEIENCSALIIKSKEEGLNGRKFEIVLVDREEQIIYLEE